MELSSRPDISMCMPDYQPTYEDCAVLIGNAVELLNEDDLDEDIALNCADALRRLLPRAPTPMQAAMEYFAEELEYACSPEPEITWIPYEAEFSGEAATVTHEPTAR